MFRLIFKHFRQWDWVATVIIVGLTVLQVYLTMRLIDYVQYLMQDIIYIHYRNNPSAMPEALYALYVGVGSDWEALRALASAGSLPESAAAMILSIIDANVGPLWRDGGIMLGLAAGSMGCQIVISALASAVAASFATHVRSAVNAKVSTFSSAEINKFSTASLVTRSTNDIEQAQTAILLMMRMVFAAPVTAIWAICKVQASSWEFTLATGASIFALVLFLSIIFFLVTPKFKISQKYTDRLNGITRESLSGIRVVHAYNAEGFQQAIFKKANDDLTKLNIFTGRALALFNPVIIIVMDGITLAIYWIGAGLINAGTVDYPVVSAFTMLAIQIIMAFMMLLLMFVLWPRAAVSAGRINEVLKTTPSIADPADPVSPDRQGSIEFRDVAFSYPDADAPVVSNINFKASKGQTVAIIGPTGSGKSSIVNLASRLYDATIGEILIDGVNIKQMKQSDLRKRIGFVPQRGVLFSGTVESNIAFGCEGELSERALSKAADVACASEFIAKMDGGFSAPIAQGGTNVSGGQKQRLCIARAVAIEPEFFIFDDSFSALDFATDLQVRKNLKKSQAEATKIIVAQRIGTIMDADEILYLEDGKVVGQGTHSQLLETCLPYRQLALSQLSKEELGL